MHPDQVRGTIGWTTTLFGREVYIYCFVLFRRLFVIKFAKLVSLAQTPFFVNYIKTSEYIKAESWEVGFSSFPNVDSIFLRITCLKSIIIM